MQKCRWIIISALISNELLNNSCVPNTFPEKRATKIWSEYSYSMNMLTSIFIECKYKFPMLCLPI